MGRLQAPVGAVAGGYIGGAPSLTPAEAAREQALTHGASEGPRPRRMDRRIPPPGFGRRPEAEESETPPAKQAETTAPDQPPAVSPASLPFRQPELAPEPKNEPAPIADLRVAGYAVKPDAE
jgi:hypothetical protein